MALDVLGVAKCDAAVNYWFYGDPVLSRVILSKSKPTMWRDTGYGVLLNIPNTYTVTSDDTYNGITERRTYHLAAVGDWLYWFPSSCDD